MAHVLFEKGREGFLDGTLDWDTQTFSYALLDLGTADTGIKAVSGATNATPIVITATSHGFTNGDLVIVGGVAGNLAANGLWKIANVAANTFELTDPITGGNVVGSAAYTSGGYAVNIGPGAAGDNWDDFDAALVGTKQNFASPTVTAGVASAAAGSVPSVTGASCECVVGFRDTGTASTSRMVFLHDGRQIVTCAAAAATSATTVAVERLQAGIPNGTVLTFSDGKTATLSALAAAGDRTLTVSALASGIAAGSRADAPRAGSGFPVTPNGNNIAINWDTGANKIFKL